MNKEKTICYVIPDFRKKTDKDDNPHLKYLLNERILKRESITIRGVSEGTYTRAWFWIFSKKKILLIFWPDEIFTAIRNRKHIRLLRFLGFSNIATIFQTFETLLFCRLISHSRFEIIWFIQEISGHQVKKGEVCLDYQFRKSLFLKSKTAILTTQVAIPLVQNHFKASKICYFESPLGDYSLHHGTKIERHKARSILKINDGVIVLIFGHFRNNYDLNFTLGQIISSGMTPMVVGRGYEEISASNLSKTLLINQFISKSEVAMYFSAADFLLKPEPKHFTSGVLRMAISYQLPIIAMPYGTNLEFIYHCGFSFNNHTDLGKCLSNLPAVNSEEYKSKISEQLQFNGRLTWAKATHGMIDAIKYSLEIQKFKK